MGSLPPELSFDNRPAFVPRTISDLVRDIASVADAAERSSKLGDLVRRLEDEMRKIDAFKRELPLCMLLIRDAILTLKLESVQCSASAPLVTQPVTAEFIPLKKDCDDTEDASPKEKEKDSKDESLGPLDLQLCTFDNSKPSTVNPPDHPQQDAKVETKRHELLPNQSAAEGALKACKSRNGAREFIQLRTFSPPATAVFPRKEDKVELPVHSLSLLTPGIKNSREKPVSADTRANFGRSLTQTVQSNSRSGAPQQSARKQRRCWSPELHRRFVNALQQLGGSQAATPKQIRELMQVDGLTNDEVKSHLQKYRLHTRRFPAAAGSPTNQTVCVLGSLWPSRDQSDDAAASKGSTSQSGSPQGPLQLCGSAGAASTTGGDSMEDDEDSKSESFSWKNHIQRTGKVDV
ncbi:transcription factor HHO6 [Punica granatum]|uniref:Transcription factor HHO6 n=1 Tax=Punica granatum TaxID=22663 RepID=A0A218XFQ2_PUNGR|nr:transcription factor HHO6 [Punica granatum]OWM83754.1 hypothetical protein CDL15_Pgr004184 [Punica granatum]